MQGWATGLATAFRRVGLSSCDDPGRVSKSALRSAGRVSAVAEAVDAELFELSDREANAATDADRDELGPDELVHRRSADGETRRRLRNVDKKGPSSFLCGRLLVMVAGFVMPV